MIADPQYIGHNPHNIISYNHQVAGILNIAELWMELNDCNHEHMYAYLYIYDMYTNICNVFKTRHINTQQHDNRHNKHHNNRKKKQ